MSLSQPQQPVSNGDAVDYSPTEQDMEIDSDMEEPQIEVFVPPQMLSNLSIPPPPPPPPPPPIIEPNHQPSTSLQEQPPPPPPSSGKIDWTSRREAGGRKSRWSSRQSKSPKPSTDRTKVSSNIHRTYSTRNTSSDQPESSRTQSRDHLTSSRDHRPQRSSGSGSNGCVTSDVERQPPQATKESARLRDRRHEQDQRHQKTGNDLVQTLMSKVGLPNSKTNTTHPYSLKSSVTPPPPSSIGSTAQVKAPENSPMGQINKLLSSAANNILTQLVSSKKPPASSSTIPMIQFIPPPMPSFDDVILEKRFPSEVPANDKKPDRTELEAKRKRADFPSKKEWQERIALEVKNSLKPHFMSKVINKSTYKEILKRSVTKITKSNIDEINQEKTVRFVNTYVNKYKKNKTSKFADNEMVYE